MDAEPVEAPPPSAPASPHRPRDADRIVASTAIAIGLFSLIEAFRIHYKGRTQATGPYEFYLAMRPDTRANLAVDQVTPGRLLPAVEYSSVYGDRWRLRSDQFVPQSF